MDLLTFIQNNPITACILAYLIGDAAYWIAYIIGNAVVASIAAGKQK